MWRVALHKKLTTLSLSAILGICCIIASASAVIAYYRYTSSHLPPNININTIYVGNLKYEEAEQVLRDNSPPPPSSTVVADVDGISIASASAQLGLNYDYHELLQTFKSAATQGRMRDRIAWRIRPLFSTQNYTVKPKYHDQKVAGFLTLLNNVVAYPGENPTVTLATSNNANSIKVFTGKRGREVDIEATKNLLNKASGADTIKIEAVVASTAAELNDEQITQVTNRAKKFVGKSIDFYYDNRDYSIADKELVSFLQLPTGYKTDSVITKVATLAAQLNRAPQEPIFEYNKDTLVVTKFSPPLDGQALDEAKTQTQIIEGLQSIENASPETEGDQTEPADPNYELTISTAPPKTSLSDTNSLGIKEKIGFGDSHYDHSIPNRIHNVAITTERISDVIVPPGAEFSFNKTLGDVSAETGYRSAYVIKNGQTALGDGGGVCQVSTTLFRSVLDAGLKVTRRLPHSYRVSYYELDSKPGVDATVYSGETDFRFVNDTPGHLLIHAQADSKNLYMAVDIYGTSDGRTSEIKDHITWNARSAPAPEYFPDPSLPAGKLVQIDWAAPGISASFINVIKDKDGKIVREDKYTSNYRPWSAKYRQGVAP